MPDKLVPAPWKWPLEPLGGPLIHEPASDVGSLVQRLSQEDDGGFVYRGQTKLYDQRSLTPSIFRNPSFGAVYHAIGLNFAASSYLLGAVPRLRDDHHQQAPGLHMESPSPEIVPQVLAQHYDFKSNLIDVTFDVRVAASFAASNSTVHQPTGEGVIFRWRAQSLSPLLHDLRQIRRVLEAASFPSLAKRSRLRPETQHAGGIWVPWSYRYQKFRHRDDYVLCAEIFPFFHGATRRTELLSTTELFPNATDPIFLFFDEWSRTDVTPLSLVSWKLYSLLWTRAEGEFVPHDLRWLLNLDTDDARHVSDRN